MFNVFSNLNNIESCDRCNVSIMIDIIITKNFAKYNFDCNCRFTIKSISKISHDINENFFVASSTHRSKFAQNSLIFFASILHKKNWTISSISIRMNFKRQRDLTWLKIAWENVTIRKKNRKKREKRSIKTNYDVINY